MKHFSPTRVHARERYTWTRIHTLGRIVKGRILTAEGPHEVCPPKKSLYLGTGQMDQDVCVGENCQSQQMIHSILFWGEIKSVEQWLMRMDHGRDLDGSKSTYTMHLTSSGGQLLFIGKGFFFIGCGDVRCKYVCTIHHEGAYHECLYHTYE